MVWRIIFTTHAVLAETNDRFVECVVRLAREFGIEISTPDEAKKNIKNLKRRMETSVFLNQQVYSRGG